jgi:hypothetical protein
MKQKITWNDIIDYGSECNRSYKLQRLQLEKQLRHHLDGANATERRQVYETFYRKRS